MTDTPASDAPDRASGGLLARLSAMMFLQYWSLGLWTVPVVTHIAANTGGQGDGVFEPGFLGYSGLAGAFGSLFAPALVGWIADRYLPAQWMLVLLHVMAGGALWAMHEASSQLGFAVAMVVFFQFYVPTVTLTNTVALRQLPDVDREFFFVRLFGTLAWISAGLFVGFGGPWLYGESIEATRVPILLAAVSEVVMAVYCLSLPHTPPCAGAGGGRNFSGSLGLWRNRPFMIFLGVSFLACIPTQSYNVANLFLNERGYHNAAGQLTLGQLTEIACMVFMSALLFRFGLKRLFLLGILGWALRYVLLALGSQGGPDSGYAWLVYTAIFIHGPCYAFVYVAGQLYIDRLVDPGSRGAAQGLHAVATSGMGHLVGALVVGWGQTKFLTPPGVDPPPYDWVGYWLVPVGISATAAIAFVYAFTDSPDEPGPEVHAGDVPPSPADALTEPVTR